MGRRRRHGIMAEGGGRKNGTGRNTHNVILHVRHIPFLPGPIVLLCPPPLPPLLLHLSQRLEFGRPYSGVVVAMVAARHVVWMALGRYHCHGFITPGTQVIAVGVGEGRAAKGRGFVAWLPSGLFGSCRGDEHEGGRGCIFGNDVS